MKKREARERSTGVPGKNDYEPIPTCGEVLRGGRLLDLVRDSRTGEERILHWHEGRSTITPKLEFDERHYVPPENAATLRHLPSKPEPYTSTERLFEKVREFAARSLAADKDEAALLAYFCFASFFGDCLGNSPCLMLFGPFPGAAISVLRFLGCVCRHPVLLADSGLHGLLRDLRPTRLMCQPDSGLSRFLPAMQFSGFEISDRGLPQLNGATAVYVGDSELKSLFANAGLQMPLSPLFRPFSPQEEAREIVTVTSLQNQLLLYRLQNFALVKSSEFDVPEFGGSTRDLARALGQRVVDAPDLQARLLDLLKPRNDAERTEATRGPDAIVVEALVVACHGRRPSIRVGEVSELANAILTRNGEYLQLTPKEVGAKLKRLGFRTTRLDSAGRGIYLLKDQCVRIHQLGRALGVPTLRAGLPGCSFCAGN